MDGLVVDDELHRRLAGYRLRDRLFREKYGMTLAEFEAAQIVKRHGYSFEVENDHQDWDQAVDGIRTIERQLAALLAHVNAENMHRQVK